MNWKTRVDLALEVRRRGGRLRELSVSTGEGANFWDNDYLGLATHPEVLAAAARALARSGSSASPLISGYQQEHAELEECLAGLYGDRSVLVWNSGYAANSAVLGALPARGDVVLADRLIHRSMIEGILRSGARLVRWDHNDAEHLESLLSRFCEQDRDVFVVCESVYSMDGDLAPLREIAELKRRFPFFWLVDEAHALGWYGGSGEGLCGELGVLDAVDLLVGTLGKAWAGLGAFTVFRDAVLRDFFVNFGSEFIYSTYLPPACAAAAREAISVSQGMREELGNARRRSRFFRDALRREGLDTWEGDSPIVPIVVGEDRVAVELARRLALAGLRVGCVRPPTVPEGEARLRVSLKVNWDEVSLWKVACLIAATLREVRRA
ncbi:aminotransferase class I/II-fold pyridoxal phosphate-dependent enzyme [Pelagicoccus sp. SDUM812005]|uniref:aminotransferase class I/II-fold pyridoxal phosphate-dependent enzyme n=1 Tax=Pelagicoccus sp. SDUM812005 TaxID=3041257 RepID=UPI00280E9773|nr:aminotransferase class I/II-fold pyridoxal phosphate-dependent enzyme [Pelagicoccus sp. SDUM812005]MDQ8182793.1 aminotransferase class I/II-fold pyridoxal phosphate-dependent enzyme [Pelagicoccus sp. SDUM812005]